MNQPTDLKQWTTLFNGIKLAIKGMNLNFMEPIFKDGEKIIELNKDETEKENTK